MRRSRSSSFSPDSWEPALPAAFSRLGQTVWQLELFNNTPRAAETGDSVLVPLVVMCIAELGRRTAQPWSLLLATVALAGDVWAGSLLATVAMFTDVVYASVLYGSRKVSRAVTPASVILTVAVTVGLLAYRPLPQFVLAGLVVATITVVPAWTGAILRRHRDEADAAQLRARQTALLAEMDRTQAVTAERARMARELHDVVAGHLSAVAIHATAAQSLPDDENGRATTREALGVIRENSVQGLAEMRRLIGLLREPGDSGEPTASPTLDGIDALLERAGGTADEAGLTLVLDDRRPPGPLPVPVGIAAYRVVQESVTNALKHASPGTVRVELFTGTGQPPDGDGDRDGPVLTVRVVSPLDGDGTRTADASPRAPGSGAGLVGMHERAELVGGALTAGPVQDPDSGKVWEVRSELPAGGHTKDREDR